MISQYLLSLVTAFHLFDPTPTPLLLSPVLLETEEEKKCPPEGDCYRWPPDEWIDEQQAKFTTTLDHLKARAECCETQEEYVKLQDLIQQNEESSSYYFWMRGVTNHDAADIAGRRSWLKKMRSMVGEQKYWSGFLPAPIPEGERR